MSLLVPFVLGALVYSVFEGFPHQFTQGFVLLGCRDLGLLQQRLRQRQGHILTFHEASFHIFMCSTCLCDISNERKLSA